MPHECVSFSEDLGGITPAQAGKNLYPASNSDIQFGKNSPMDRLRDPARSERPGCQMQLIRMSLLCHLEAYVRLDIWLYYYDMQSIIDMISANLLERRACENFFQSLLPSSSHPFQSTPILPASSIQASKPPGLQIQASIAPKLNI